MTFTKCAAVRRRIRMQTQVFQLSDMFATTAHLTEKNLKCHTLLSYTKQNTVPLNTNTTLS